MATIKTISKCFKEVQRLTGDLLPDEKINEIITIFTTTSA